MAQIDLYSMKDEDMRNLAIQVSKEVNLSQLRKMVHKVTLELSQAGEPRFGAEVKAILKDDQQRLNLIYQLNYNLEIFEGWVKNLRRNKYDCINDDEALFNLLVYTQDMMETIVDYGKFKIDQREENQKQLENNMKYFKVLEGGRK
jgi:hypothetical protein